jgi:hypothetical protein
VARLEGHAVSDPVCLCPKEANGNRCGRNLLCPEHGDVAMRSGRYEFTDADKAWLRQVRIGALTREELDDIQQVRQADEDRFRRE